MIEKVNRTYTEKTTSIDQEIELSQKGIMTFVPRAATGNDIGIPCMISDPRLITLTPMTGLTASALLTTGGYSCDLVLYKASDVYNTFASIASGILLAEVGRRLRMSSDYKLYVAKASMAATSCASNTRLASGSVFRQLEQFGTNQKRYLKVVIDNAASGALQAQKQTLAYEIRGY
jgi:hypothetical protein